MKASTKRTRNNFERVIEAARNKSHNKLNRTLPNSTFTHKDFKYQSAAGYLAMNGEFEAAEWLVKKGADTSLVIQGAACGGHNAFVWKYLDSNKDKFKIYARHAATGAAQGGQTALRQQLLKLESTCYIDAACGAAKAGLVDYLKKILSQNLNLHSLITINSALSGNEKFTEELVNNHQYLSFPRHLYTNTREQLITKAAIGAAEGGHIEYSRCLMNKLRHNDDFLCKAAYVAQGAARGGYIDYARELIHEGAQPHRVIVHAAHNGHIDFAAELLENYGGLNDKNLIFLGTTCMNSPEKVLFMLQHLSLQTIENRDKNIERTHKHINTQIIMDAIKTRMMLGETAITPSHEETTNDTESADHKQNPICSNLTSARILTARNKNGVFYCQALQTHVLLPMLLTLQRVSENRHLPSINRIVFSYIIGGSPEDAGYAVLNRKRIISILNINQDKDKDTQQASSNKSNNSL